MALGEILKELAGINADGIHFKLSKIIPLIGTDMREYRVAPSHHMIADCVLKFGEEVLYDAVLKAISNEEPCIGPLEIIQFLEHYLPRILGAMEIGAAEHKR